MTDNWWVNDLACPDCQRSLTLPGTGVSCECGFAIGAGTPLDLRPQRPRDRVMVGRIGSEGERELDGCRLERPGLEYSGPRATRDSAELFSAAQPWLGSGKRLLDLGCGQRDQAVPASHLGLHYAGIDFNSASADILADAHAIPFCDLTFDAVLAYAVLEHLYNPYLAVQEVARVLRPGGIFFGAVSQGEPYHLSFFHHTLLGIAAVCRASDLQIARFWPSYDTLHALATMGKYAKAIRLLIEAVYRFHRATPVLAPRSFFGRSPREKQLEELYRAASICFVVMKRPIE